MPASPNCPNQNSSILLPPGTEPYADFLVRFRPTPSVQPVSPATQPSKTPISLLYELCTTRALHPTFDCPPSLTGGFGATLVLGHGFPVLQEAGPFASKKEAQHHIARRACHILRHGNDPGSTSAGAEDATTTPAPGPPENYIGTLQGKPSLRALFLTPQPIP